MREHSEESSTPTESLEEALTRNLSALSGETESTDSTPLTDGGDVTSDEVSEEAELEAGTEQESQDALEPPEKWKDEWKDSFKSLPLEAQKILLDRHKDVESHLTKETQSLSETRKRYEKLDDVLKPYSDALRTRGIDIEPHVANALQAYFAYQQDPVSTLKNLISTAGLTADQFFEDETVDPSIRALRAELEETKRQLAKIEQRPDEQESTAKRQLDEFTSAKNDDGTPKYPHFEQVKTLMAPLVANGKTLEDAYKEVLWTLPEYRQEQLKASEKKAKDELEAKRKQKAEKAKKASDVLPPRNVDGNSGTKPAKSWEDRLKVTLENMSGG